jgi:hypothetical protein
MMRQPQEAEEICLVPYDPNFYRHTIESILSGCIIAWYGKCTIRNHMDLQKVVQSAQRITRGILPALQDIYSTWCQRKDKKIKDLSLQSHGLFIPFPSRR